MSQPSRCTHMSWWYWHCAELLVMPMPGFPALVAGVPCCWGRHNQRLSRKAGIVYAAVKARRFGRPARGPSPEATLPSCPVREEAMSDIVSVTSGDPVSPYSPYSPHCRCPRLGPTGSLADLARMPRQAGPYRILISVLFNPGSCNIQGTAAHCKGGPANNVPIGTTTDSSREPLSRTTSHVQL
jgi:hypothetical protein